MSIFQKFKKCISSTKESNPMISDSNFNIDTKLLEKFFGNLKDFVCIADYDGKISYINNKELYGNYQNLKEVMLYEQNNEITYEETISKVFRDGEFIGSVVLNKDNIKIDTFVISYNIPDQKKIFIYIKNLNEYCDQEIKLQKEIEKKDEYIHTKDLFIANLSHEIRTPINSIVGMLYFLKSTELSEKQIEYIQKLEQSSALLLEIVNNILDLSKGSENVIIDNKVNFNLKEFLDNVYNIFVEKTNEKHLQLYTTYDFDTDFDIYADKSRISQIFVNLIDNAIKYTEKGYIEIIARKVEENNFSYKLQFCIKDTGIGVKREDSLKIFAEFERADDPTIKEKAGSGMGLAITKKIIENMDGKIWVESNVDLGSKFYFDIVVSKSNEDSHKIKENTLYKNISTSNVSTNINNSQSNISNSTTSNIEKIENNANIDLNNINFNNVITDLANKRILIVEDNEINQEITSKLLEEIGIASETVSDGTECLKRIEEVGKNYYSLILMDIHMPKHNGYEISRILKDNMGVTIPIVALTATNITQQVVDDNKKYIASYMQKPIIPAEFKKKVIELLSAIRSYDDKLSFIDSFDSAMERVGNSKEMFVKLLNIFYNTYINIDKDLANCQNADDKYLYIHSLKGAIGNLGCQSIFRQLGELEILIKSGSDKEAMEQFLVKFHSILKELRESSYIKSGIKKILSISSNKEKQEKEKDILYPYFEVITTQKESDVYLILDTYNIDAILLYDLDLPDQGVSLIKNLKNNDKYKNLPLIFINDSKNPELKLRVLETSIDEYLETLSDVEDIKWHIDNAISKKQDELKLKTDLKKSNSEIKNVYDFLYGSLVHLTSYKSKETGEHLLRTKEYMKQMLKEYENFYHTGEFVDEKTVEDIAISATLHDIGKVGIPDNVLNKPGRLTDEEYNIIKSHVVIGRDTLEGTYGNKISNDVLQYAKDIVYHHHEKYDGTGYPEKLKGDEISTICRIMAVIDVYDALVNDRVYKKAMPYDEAEQYIIDQSGKAFDPKVINIFKIVKDNLRKINEENKDKVKA